MLCINCGQSTSRIIIKDGREGCANCWGVSENGGAKISGILTRNSERVRAQQERYEGDMILPHTFDPNTGQIIPNPDFVDMYADQLPTYFTEKELNKAGYSKAGKIYEKKAAMEAEVEAERQEVEFAGSEEDMSNVVDELGEYTPSSGNKG